MSNNLFHKHNTNSKNIQKRKSIKRKKSTKRKSIKKKSIKRKSIKRKSIKRKSIKRKSIKRKSIKRKTRTERFDGGINFTITANKYLSDIFYFYDESFKRSLHFFIKDAPQSKIGSLCNELFTYDKIDPTRIYFKRRTILGFMIVTGYLDDFITFLNNLSSNKAFKNILTNQEIIVDKTKTINVISTSLSSIPVPSTIPPLPLPTSQVILEEIINYIPASHPIKFKDETTNDLIKSIKKKDKYFEYIYHETEQFFKSIAIDEDYYYKYFCFNYEEKKLTGLKCEEEKFDETEMNKEIIKLEIILKCIRFFYYFKDIETQNSHLIINHYLLHLLKSDQKNKLIFELSTEKIDDSFKKYFMKFSGDNMNFSIMNYMSLFTYKDKTFSTCGETTLLNLLNYFLIKENGDFDTTKIQNKKVQQFYSKYKNMIIMNKNSSETTTEWLDIVSNFDKDIYNEAGDIRNSLRNFVYVLNEITKSEGQDEFFTSDRSDNEIKLITILEKINDIHTIEIMENDDFALNIDNKFHIILSASHAEMINIENIDITEELTKFKIKAINKFKKSDTELDLIYNIFYKIVNTEIDFNNAKSEIIKLIIYNKKNRFDIINTFISKNISIDNSVPVGDYDSLIIFENIDQFINLEFLDLPNDKINDIDALSTLTKLYFLNLSDNEITNIESLKFAIRLKKLYLSMNKIVDIKVLSNLSNLQSLSISANMINDISSLQNLKDLKYLNLSHNRITNITSLKDLTILDNLHLDLNLIQDISPLSNLTKLTKLTLSGNRFKNIDYLSGLINLENLVLSTNILTDITPLKNLVNISNLDLSFNDIEDISPLSNLINLVNIYLSFNKKITNISPLHSLKKLNTLYLDGNKITDISPLVGIPLKKLDLSHNQLNDDCFVHLEKIKDCNILLSNNNLDINKLDAFLLSRISNEDM